ncbi:hypothetical protein RLOatenuis_5750 [Rickettsiales bacterium]|nr:hypothetical protein RLOatenuis_5750 [Rickettsiales bacterium]
MAEKRASSLTIKKVTVPCSFAGNKSPFTVYIGYPKDDSPHPLYFQSKWAQDKSGVIPEPIIKSISDIYRISQKNRLDFPSLFTYAMQLATYKKQISTVQEEESDSEKP